MKWISTNDRQPPLGETVLLAFRPTNKYATGFLLGVIGGKESWFFQGACVQSCLIPTDWCEIKPPTSDPRRGKRGAK